MHFAMLVCCEHECNLPLKWFVCNVSQNVLVWLFTTAMPNPNTVPSLVMVTGVSDVLQGYLHHILLLDASSSSSFTIIVTYTQPTQSWRS
jgi:hypothetical protein